MMVISISDSSNKAH